MKYREIADGIFVDRPNRFIAHVGVNGAVETVHVKNTGRCKELLLPGTAVRLEVSDNPKRKTKWALGFASLIVMMVYSSKKTDRKAAAAGHKTAASAEKKDYDPLRAAFVFDDDEDVSQKKEK